MVITEEKFSMSFVILLVNNFLPINNKEMINEILINGTMYKLESIWRKTKSDKTRDSRGNKYPFPKEGTGWSASKYFVDRLNDVQTHLDMKPNPNKTIMRERIYDQCLDCILCDETCITDKKYYANSFFWENFQCRMGRVLYECFILIIQLFLNKFQMDSILSIVYGAIPALFFVV